MALAEYLGEASLYVSAPWNDKVLIFKDEWRTVGVERPRGIMVGVGGAWSVVGMNDITSFVGDKKFRTLHCDIREGHEAIRIDGGYFVTDPRRSSVTFVPANGLPSHYFRVPGVDVSDDNRSHVNGIAIDPARTKLIPLYATVLGISNEKQGWRDEVANSRGAVINMASGELIHKDLFFPHSPRMHDGALWFLDSGRGAVRCGDATFAKVKGFARGLAFHNDYVFVGVSQSRPTAIPMYSIDPLAEPGIVVLDKFGQQVHFEPLDVREVFDVQIG